MLPLQRMDRRGLSLTEILIGIMILGIGVLSLATLFPLGLLQMRQAVNDTRATILARNAWSEVRIRNLLSPPLGPEAVWFSVYPVAPARSPVPYWPSTVAAASPFVVNTGSGMPVVVDPLWMIYAPAGVRNLPDPRFDAFGRGDLDGDGAPDFAAAAGLLRLSGGLLYGAGSDGAPGAARADDNGFGGRDDAMELGWPNSRDWPNSLDVPMPMPLNLAMELFASPDELVYADVNKSLEGPVAQVPWQARNGGGPSLLRPTNGTPWASGGGISTLARKPRYTWLVIARKADAAQGLGPGPDGQPGVAGTDDDGNGIADDRRELGWLGSDDTLADCGPNQSSGWIPSAAPLAAADTLDDPAQNMASGAPVPAPVGPFDVTVIVFANRDFTSREPVYTNQVPSGGGLPAPIFVAGQAVATLFARGDGIPFPEIPVGSYIMDTTFDLTSPQGRRNGYVYRVVGKSLSANGSVLTLSLDRPARATGWVLTVLRKAIAVFGKQVP